MARRRKQPTLPPEDTNQVPEEPQTQAVLTEAPKQELPENALLIDKTLGIFIQRN